MRNSTLILIGVLLLAVVLGVTAVLASAHYFDTPNIFAVAGDVWSVVAGDAPYAVLDTGGLQLVAKSEAELSEYAAFLGYPTRLTDGELATSDLHVYSSGDALLYVEKHDYALFSVWKVRER